MFENEKIKKHDELKRLLVGKKVEVISNSERFEQDSKIGEIGKVVNLQVDAIVEFENGETVRIMPNDLKILND